MEKMLGFQIGIWDYLTFAALLIIIIFFLSALVFILGLPGRIAVSRKHPDAEAVNLMAWLGFLGVVPWIQALFWAFKPTDVVDIRNMPEEQQRQTEEMIKRMTKESPPKPLPPEESKS